LREAESGPDDRSRLVESLGRRLSLSNQQLRSQWRKERKKHEAAVRSYERAKAAHKARMRLRDAAKASQ
jgi:hypothetical protein